ncbi:hypothetical protein [Agrobacterium vitis]|uniref:hypothetical protein n=1 Tax=Agrobacterium vitis TaxID=373 RepID=UPI0012E8C872|nr:hypothetical protein [Agrobacterium vitis]MVA37107.1 hypothetical protein [Agrobacterium vitis]
MTTNLDTQKAVVWNMGAIADSRRPDALQLFREVLIASASIPGGFPAVKIKAYTGTRLIEQLHSDGGSSSQLFILPEHAMAIPEQPKRDKKIHIHVIVNNALIPEFAMTSNTTLSVVGRGLCGAREIKNKTGSSRALQLCASGGRPPSVGGRPRC